MIINEVMYKCRYPPCEREFLSRNSRSGHERWCEYNMKPEVLEQRMKRKEKISNTLMGHVITKETREKMSNSKKGMKYESWTKKRKEEFSKTVLSRTNPNLIQDFFEEIDTEEKAYWLGFMYGDGCVGKDNNAIQITLKESDKEHLEKFKNIIKANNKLREYEFLDKKRNKKNKECCLNIQCLKMKDDLIKWGCVPNKSLKLESIPDIPKELVKHFIRGEFDADGGIGVYEYRRSYLIYITGHKPFIKDINKFLVENGIFDHYNKLNKHKNSVVTMKYNGKQIIKFLDWIYKDAKIYLDRKYTLYKYLMV